MQSCQGPNAVCRSKAWKSNWNITVNPRAKSGTPHEATASDSQARRLPYNETPGVLGPARGLKDKESAGNSKRVPLLSLEFDKSRACTSKSPEQFRPGARLQDVCQICNPNAILLMAGRLTADSKEVTQ